MTVMDLLQESRDAMLYYREQNEQMRFARMEAHSPRKRDFDTAAIALADREKELEETAQEAIRLGKRAYVLIGCIEDRRQREVLWAWYAYGLNMKQAATRAGTTEEKAKLILRQGEKQVEKAVRECMGRRREMQCRERCL